MTDLYALAKDTYTMLNNMVIKGRVPHALIFAGEKSTPKKEMAKEFSKMLYASYLGEDVAKLTVYKRIDDEMMPNIIYIRRDKQTTISVEQIRDVMSETSVSSMENGPKIYIFEDADYLGTASSNAVLKFVEEPIDGTYIIFITDDINNILNTIQSRCALIKFKPLQKDAVIERISKPEYDRDYLSAVVEYTKKDEEIIKIMEDPKMLEIYNLVTDMFLERFEQRGSMVIYFNEHIQSLIEKGMEEYKEFFISLFTFYLTDILRIKKNPKSDLTFIGEKERINRISKLLSDKAIDSIIKEALDIKQQVMMKKSINFPLYMNLILLKIEMKGRR